MILEDILVKDIAQAFNKLFNVELPEQTFSLQPTKKEFAGSHTLVVFPLARHSKKKPEETAQIIGEYLKENNSEIEDFNVIKGFLNLTLSEKAWVNAFNTLLKKELVRHDGDNKKVIIEYSSPNTNKPLHLGHLRNNFLGYSVAEILKANGYKVDKINLVNDRGIHICKSMLAYKKFGAGETPETANIKGDHLTGKYYVIFDQQYKKEIQTLVHQGTPPEQAKKEAPLLKEAQEMLKKWEQNDQEVVALWQKMNNWVYQGFDETYRNIGVDFDKYYYESQTYLLGKDLVKEGLDKGVFYTKENGSVWVDLSDEGLDQKLLLRADGTSVYMTQDLGTAELKYNDFQFEKSIYVVGNEQDYHFDVLFKILKKLGKPYSEGMYHLSYGMVDLPSGKMKSREGTVVDADDLVQEVKNAAAKITSELGKIEGLSEEAAEELYAMIGLGALKFFLLKVDPKKRMLFNPEESVQLQGNTGPFVQYTHARIAAIIRKATESNYNYEDTSFMNNLQEMNENEKEVTLLLANYQEKLKEAARNYDPSVIAQYIFDLAKEYNRFYADVPIFNEKDENIINFRVALSKKVAETIKSGMLLLGIKVPDRM
jgi:arginyl-tRNA synthetase